MVQVGVEVVGSAHGGGTGAVGRIGAFKRRQPSVVVIVGVVVVGQAVPVGVVVGVIAVAVHILHVIGNAVVVEVGDVGRQIHGVKGVLVGATDGR